MSTLYWAIIVVGVVSNITGYFIGYIHKEYKINKHREVNFNEELNLPEVPEQPEKYPQYH